MYFVKQDHIIIYSDIFTDYRTVLTWLMLEQRASLRKIFHLDEIWCDKEFCYSPFKWFQPIIIILTYFVVFIQNFWNTTFSVASSLLELFFAKLKSLYYAYFLAYTSLITEGKSLHNMVLGFLLLSSKTSPFTDYKNALILWPFFHCHVHSLPLTLSLAAFYCSLTDRFPYTAYATFSLWPYFGSLKT